MNPEPFNLNAAMTPRTVGGELPRVQAGIDLRVDKGELPVGTQVYTPLDPATEYQEGVWQYALKIPAASQARFGVALLGSPA